MEDKNMKNEYMKPATQVVKLQHQSMVCVSLNNVDGNVGLDYQGGGSGSARARRHGVWDDDWDEE